MRPSRLHHALNAEGSQYGGSVIIAVVALPLLLVFLFAVLDFGRIAFLGAEVSSAAHAVCRAVQESPALANSSDDLRRVAIGACPSLAAEGLDLSVDVRVDAEAPRVFNRKLYDWESDAFAEQPTRLQACSVEVDLAVRGTYLTPLGSMVAIAGDKEAPGSEGFVCASQAQGRLDETIEGGG